MIAELDAVQLIASEKQGCLVGFINSTNLTASAQKILPKKEKQYALKSKIRDTSSFRIFRSFSESGFNMSSEQQQVNFGLKTIQGSNQHQNKFKEK